MAQEPYLVSALGFSVRYTFSTLRYGIMSLINYQRNTQTDFPQLFGIRSTATIHVRQRRLTGVFPSRVAHGSLAAFSTDLTIGGITGQWEPVLVYANGINPAMTTGQLIFDEVNSGDIGFPLKAGLILPVLVDSLDDSCLMVYNQDETGATTSGYFEMVNWSDITVRKPLSVDYSFGHIY